MKNDPQSVEAENVISVTFGEVSNEISHPASKNYPLELDDDPLQDLLDEAGLPEDDENDQLDSMDLDEHYIFAHQKSWDLSVQMNDNLLEMSQILEGQVSRLKEDVKRLKYYLDEINLD